MLNTYELYLLKKAKKMIKRFLNNDLSGPEFEKKYLKFNYEEIINQSWNGLISRLVQKVLEEEFYHIDGYCSFKELQDGEDTFDNYGDKKLKRLSKKTLARIQQFLDGVDPEQIDLTPFYD